MGRGAMTDVKVDPEEQALWHGERSAVSRLRSQRRLPQSRWSLSSLTVTRDDPGIVSTQH